MRNYIDIHSHILPQVDDGANSLEQTKHMLECAYDEGIRTIIATPHYYEGKEKDFFLHMEESLSDMKEKLDFFSNKITFHLGCEIFYSHESVNLLNDKKIPTLAGSHYVLVEFSPTAEYSYIRNGIQEFLFGGYRPILAHIERYPNIIKDTNQIKKLITMGSYIQVNAMSIVGKTGKEQQKIVKKLLKNHLVHFIATDAHNDRERAPKLKKCVEYLTRKYGEAYAVRLLEDNPYKVLKNEYL